MRPKNTVEDFWAKVDKSSDCWLWMGSRQDERGYGRFWLRNKNIRAHRLSYELTRGSIPEHLEIDHLCRVRHCVNPDHLEVVTHAENTRRSKGLNRKTHCIHGHALIERYDRQICKECQREAGLRYKLKKRLNHQ